MKLSKYFITFSSVAVLSLGGVTFAEAREISADDMNHILSVAGVESHETEAVNELLSALENDAKANGVSVDEFAHQVASESKITLEKSREYAQNQGVSLGVVMPLGSGGDEIQGATGRWIGAGKARYIGDIFYTPLNSYKGMIHGHNGIYISYIDYVESANPVEGVVRRSGNKKYALSPVFKYYVGWDKQSPNKYKAANFAKSKIGKSYNWKFWQKPVIHSDYYNCSQLVWAAYKSTDPNVDMNVIPMDGVYPGEIALSKWTTLYETVWS